ncbi:hypothetical protein ADUPG1_010731, partial [Aduncisulcus paluster]
MAKNTIQAEILKYFTDNSIPASKEEYFNFRERLYRLFSIVGSEKVLNEEILIPSLYSSIFYEDFITTRAIFDQIDELPVTSFPHDPSKVSIGNQLFLELTRICAILEVQELQLPKKNQPLSYLTHFMPPSKRNVLLSHAKSYATNACKLSTQVSEIIIKHFLTFKKIEGIDAESEEEKEEAEIDPLDSLGEDSSEYMHHIERIVCALNAALKACTRCSVPICPPPSSVAIEPMFRHVIALREMLSTLLTTLLQCCQTIVSTHGHSIGVVSRLMEQAVQLDEQMKEAKEKEKEEARARREAEESPNEDEVEAKGNKKDSKAKKGGKPPKKSVGKKDIKGSDIVVPSLSSAALYDIISLIHSRIRFCSSLSDMLKPSEKEKEEARARREAEESPNEDEVEAKGNKKDSKAKKGGKPPKKSVGKKDIKGSDIVVPSLSSAALYDIISLIHSRIRFCSSLSDMLKPSVDAIVHAKAVLFSVIGASGDSAVNSDDLFSHEVCTVQTMVSEGREWCRIVKDHMVRWEEDEEDRKRQRNKLLKQRKLERQKELQEEEEEEERTAYVMFDEKRRKKEKEEENERRKTVLVELSISIAKDLSSLVFSTQASSDSKSSKGKESKGKGVSKSTSKESDESKDVSESSSLLSALTCPCFFDISPLTSMLFRFNSNSNNISVFNILPSSQMISSASSLFSICSTLIPYLATCSAFRSCQTGLIHCHSGSGDMCQLSISDRQKETEKFVESVEKETKRIVNESIADGIRWFEEEIRKVHDPLASSSSASTSSSRAQTPKKGGKKKGSGSPTSGGVASKSESKMSMDQIQQYFVALSLGCSVSAGMWDNLPISISCSLVSKGISMITTYSKDSFHDPLASSSSASTSSSRAQTPKKGGKKKGSGSPTSGGVASKSESKMSMDQIQQYFVALSLGCSVSAGMWDNLPISISCSLVSKGISMITTYSKDSCGCDGLFSAIDSDAGLDKIRSELASSQDPVGEGGDLIATLSSSILSSLSSSHSFSSSSSPFACIVLLSLHSLCGSLSLLQTERNLPWWKEGHDMNAALKEIAEEGFEKEKEIKEAEATAVDSTNGDTGSTSGGKSSGAKKKGGDSSGGAKKGKGSSSNVQATDISLWSRWDKELTISLRSAFIRLLPSVQMLKENHEDSDSKKVNTGVFGSADIGELFRAVQLIADEMSRCCSTISCASSPSDLDVRKKDKLSVDSSFSEFVLRSYVSQTSNPDSASVISQHCAIVSNSSLHKASSCVSFAPLFPIVGLCAAIVTCHAISHTYNISPLQSSCLAVCDSLCAWELYTPPRILFSLAQLCIRVCKKSMNTVMKQSFRKHPHYGTTQTFATTVKAKNPIYDTRTYASRNYVNPRSKKSHLDDKAGRIRSVFHDQTLRACALDSTGHAPSTLTRPPIPSQQPVLSHVPFSGSGVSDPFNCSEDTDGMVKVQSWSVALSMLCASLMPCEWIQERGWVSKHQDEAIILEPRPLELEDEYEEEYDSECEDGFKFTPRKKGGVGGGIHSEFEDDFEYAYEYEYDEESNDEEKMDVPLQIDDAMIRLKPSNPLLVSSLISNSLSHPPQLVQTHSNLIKSICEGEWIRDIFDVSSVEDSEIDVIHNIIDGRFDNLITDVSAVERLVRVAIQIRQECLGISQAGSLQLASTGASLSGQVVTQLLSDLKEALDAWKDVMRMKTCVLLGYEGHETSQRSSEETMDEKEQDIIGGSKRTTKRRTKIKISKHIDNTNKETKKQQTLKMAKTKEKKYSKAKKTPSPRVYLYPLFLSPVESYLVSSVLHSALVSLQVHMKKLILSKRLRVGTKQCSDMCSGIVSIVNDISEMIGCPSLEIPSLMLQNKQTTLIHDNIRYEKVVSYSVKESYIKYRGQKMIKRRKVKVTRMTKIRPDEYPGVPKLVFPYGTCTSPSSSALLSAALLSISSVIALVIEKTAPIPHSQGKISTLNSLTYSLAATIDSSLKSARKSLDLLSLCHMTSLPSSTNDSGNSKLLSDIPSGIVSSGSQYQLLNPMTSVLSLMRTLIFSSYNLCQSVSECVKMCICGSGKKERKRKQEKVLTFGEAHTHGVLFASLTRVCVSLSGWLRGWSGDSSSTGSTATKSKDKAGKAGKAGKGAKSGSGNEEEETPSWIGEFSDLVDILPTLRPLAGKETSNTLGLVELYPESNSMVLCLLADDCCENAAKKEKFRLGLIEKEKQRREQIRKTRR